MSSPLLVFNGLLTFFALALYSRTMFNLHDILSIAQIIVSFLLMAAVLLQQRGSGFSSVFGGGSEGYHTKRGFEKILFISTIVLAGLFLFSTFIALPLK